MRIGIDARMLGPENGGLGRYVEQLVKGLLAVEDGAEYVLFLKKENWDAPPSHLRIRRVLADIPWYGWREQLLFSSIIRRERVDLMHFPHWNVPLFFRGPFVVTIHDLILLHYPTRDASALGPFTYWVKHGAYRLALWHAVRAARHVFVTSEFTKEDVHSTLQVPLEKMSVTYQAPMAKIFNFQFFPPPPGPRQRAVAIFNSIAEKHGISRPYVLYVGVAYPHKNLPRLLQAWELCCGKYGDGYQLVLAGKENYFYRRLLAQKSFHYSIFQSSIIYAGWVNDEDLDALYSRAALYVFPSLYEGFGLPPLEAMTHGVPVVSSNRACLPEVLGEAALYFDPENVEQMADCMHTGLTDENIRSTLRENAKHELERYSLSRMIDCTIVGYRRAMADR